MGHGQGRGHGDPQRENRHAGFGRDGEDDRDQEDDADFEEESNADDEGSQHNGDLNPFLTEGVDQRMGDPVRPARIGDQSAEHRAEAEDQGQLPQLAADPVLDTGGDLRRRHAQPQGDGHGGDDQGHVGVHFKLDN